MMPIEQKMRNKTRIAQVPGDQIPFSPNLPFTQYSIPTTSYLITEELVKRGHEVTVFAPSDSETSADIAHGWIPSTDPIFKKYKVAVEKKPTKIQIQKRGKRIELFKDYCRNIVKQADKFDIIHNHCHGFLPFIRELKIPVVTTLHHPLFTAREKNYLFPKEKKEYFSQIMFVGISQKQIDKNSQLNFVGKVYHGIELNKFPFNQKPDNYLFYLSRIHPFKGVLEAIKAAKSANEKLILSGVYSLKKDYYIKDYIKEVLQEAKDKNIEMKKRLDYQQKIYYYSNAKAFLFPIKWEEPFGLVMIEAMACGTPVIAFNKGSVPEIVKDGETGFVVKNLKEMVEAIKKINVIDRKKCRTRVEENFTVEKMVDGYEKIYSEVIEKYKKNI